METGDNIWEVFIQKKPGIAFKHAGSVHGYDKKMAVQNPRDAYLSLIHISYPTRHIDITYPEI